MNNCAEGGAMAAASNGECFLPQPPAYPPMPPQHMMMAGPPPSYWAHQQQQQISMHQHSQLLDMPPSTSSQDNGGDFLHSGGPGGYSQTQPLSESSVFNGGNGTGPNSTAFQQQFQDFQQFPLIKNVGQSQQQFPCMDNFSPGHNTNGRFAGQQNTRQQLHHQQISSPSVTSTADFLSNPTAQQQQMMPQQFDVYSQQQQHHQQFPMSNGFPGHQISNNSSTETNTALGVGVQGQCDSPILGRQSTGQQQSFSSPLSCQQQQRWQQIMPQPPQIQMGMLLPNESAAGGPMAPQMQIGHPMSNQILLPTNGPIPPPSNSIDANGIPTRFPLSMMPANGQHPMMGLPQMMMAQNGGPFPPFFNRRSFLFNTPMANKAANDIRIGQMPNMAHWHLNNMNEWHLKNPSTSKASFEMLQQPPKTTNNTQGQGKSPTAPQSRSTKRKASAQTTTPQEHPNAVNSPALSTAAGGCAGSNSHGIPAPGHFNNPQSVPAVIDGHGPNHFHRHSSVDVCDSSTNGEFSATTGLFRRPPSRMSSQSNTGIAMSTASYMSPNIGQPKNQQNCLVRMDDENPLKKMEIMATKTLNDQPSEKIARMMGMDEETQQSDNIMGNITKQEKLRKLYSIEEQLSQFTSDNAPSPSSQIQPPPFCGQSHAAALFMQQGGDRFCPPPGPRFPQMAPQGGADPNQQQQQMPSQFGRAAPPQFFHAPGGQIIQHQMPPDNFGLHQQQQNSPSAFPFFQPHFPAQMRNLPNGMSPNQQQILFPVTDAQQHQQINAIQMGAAGPPNFWMPPTSAMQMQSVQSLEGLDNRVPSLKMQHMSNGQQQIMAATGAGGTNAGINGPGMSMQ